MFIVRLQISLCACACVCGLALSIWATDSAIDNGRNKQFLQKKNLKKKIQKYLESKRERERISTNKIIECCIQNTVTRAAINFFI